jgi:hypothetical protein
MKSWIVGMALAVSVGWAGMVASAATVNVTYHGVIPGSQVSLAWTDASNIKSNGSVTTNAGQYNFDVNAVSNGAEAVITGTQLKTWCIDVEGITNPGNYTFNVLDPDFALGDYQVPYFYNAAAIKNFFNGFYNPSLFSGSDVNAAAFQLCIWELAWDTTPGNVTSGTFYETSAPVDVVTQANTWLTNFNSHNYSQLGNYSIVQLSYDNVQDQIFAVPVPLPAALPIGAAMLAGMFGVRKLRRRA